MNTAKLYPIGIEISYFVRIIVAYVVASNAKTEKKTLTITNEYAGFDCNAPVRNQSASFFLYALLLPDRHKTDH